MEKSLKESASARMGLDTCPIKVALFIALLLPYRHEHSPHHSPYRRSFALTFVALFFANQTPAVFAAGENAFSGFRFQSQRFIPPHGLVSWPAQA